MTLRVLALFAALAGVSHAATPTTISHQIRLADGLGSPINGPTTLEFRIYASPTDTGTPEWDETWPNAPLEDGYLSVALGSIEPFPTDLFADGPLYLATFIGNEEVGPRTPILAVPVAITSQRAEMSASPPVACDDPEHYGRIYFDTATNRFQGCDDRGWGRLGGGVSGPDVPSGGSGSIDRPGRTCLDIHEANPSFGDGLYWIDPDGDGNLVQVQCDMTRAGGGWTLGLKTWYQGGIHNTGGAVGSVVDGLTLEGNNYKLSDDDIRAIIGPDHRFDVLGDQAGHNTTYSTGNYEFAVLENYTANWTFTAMVSASQTPTKVTSYRASDGAVAWEGDLECGNPTYNSTGGRGISCRYTKKGVNAFGGPHCDINMGTDNTYDGHRFTMSENNSDSYIYLCNGRQHSSSHALSHRWWFRERPVERTATIGTSSNPGTSCLDILTQDPTAESDRYYIRPGGVGTPIQVQCDMETAGGGWTLGLKHYYNDGMHGHTGTWGDISNALTINNQPYKLADSTINDIVDGTNAPYEMLVTTSGYNSTYSIGNLEYVTIENWSGAFNFGISMPDSNTPPVMRSWRARDDVQMWSGRLLCGHTTGGVHSGSRGVNCYNVASGSVNPQGGAGCDEAAWPNNISHSSGYHSLYMSNYNGDTYTYLCNGAQHSSGQVMNHLWWFRETTP